MLNLTNQQSPNPSKAQMIRRELKGFEENAVVGYNTSGLYISWSELIPLVYKLAVRWNDMEYLELKT